jgi:cell division protease FtsH
MSITTTGDKDKELAIPKRHAWETEETLVDERKKLRNRLRRWFSLRRIVLLAVVIAALFDAAVMGGIINFFDQIGAAFNQLFAFDITNLAGQLVRVLFMITIAIGQFALIFWFLGRARMYTIWPGSATEGVGFKDYRGQPELLDQAKQIVTLLRGVRVFEESGGEPLNGVLLEGPPGTGKTWLAQAISTEAGVPFFYLDGSSLQSMFMGIAPLKVGNLYRKARRAAKDYGAAIVFIDEIDAIGSRGGISEAEGREKDLQSHPNRLPIMMGMGSGQGLLSTLLVEMDGFSLEHGTWARRKRWFYKNILRRSPPKLERRVLTMGATNRIHALDKALLRAGRFDKKIRVDAPDLEGRRDIIEYYMSNMAHDETMDPLVLAAETQNYTPADIKYLLNEALRYALFDGRTYVTYEDFRRAQPEHEYGMRSPIRNLDPVDKYRLAAHEAGHAVALRIYQPMYRISRITIIRQGMAHGYVSWQPTMDDPVSLWTYEQLMNRLRVAIAGKAGEMEFCGEGAQTLGVGGDFAGIRYVLDAMANAGMFGALGASRPEAEETMRMKEELFLTVLSEVRLILRTHHEMVEALITELLKHDELLANEVEDFFDQYGLYTPKIEVRRPSLTAAKEN